MAAIGTTRREKVEAREAAIVKAARAVFVEYGLEGARVAEIGRRAGIAEGTVYLYYKTKSDLMRAVLKDFWDTLVRDASSAVALYPDPLAQLRALAHFHLNCVIEEHAFLGLAAKLGDMSEEADLRRDYMRPYVAVFDSIFQRCIDRAVFHTNVQPWIPRDLFYGTLEYSARTLRMRNAQRRSGVIDNLMQVFQSSYGHHAGQGGEPDTDTVERLEAAVARLEALAHLSGR